MEAHEPFDEKSYPILYVDDEEPNLLTLDYVLGSELTIHLASNAEQALRMVHEREYAVVLADHRMPSMSGVELCELVAEISPLTVRMILTAYAEHSVVVDAVERGRVHRYLLKPFRNESLHLALSLGVRMFHYEKTARELQRQLVESSQAHAGRALRAEVAQEIASLVQPLTIRLASVSRQLDGNASPKLQQSVRAARADADRLRQAVLRWMATPQRQESCQAASVAGSVTRLFERLLPSDVTLTLAIEDDPAVPMAAAALAQVLLNLLLNAKQALAAQGNVGSIEVQVTSLGPEVLIRVGDDGDGIAPETAPHIFSAGFTTRSERPGNGLAVAKRLVEEAGGEIELRSQSSGRGVDARIKLQRATEM